MKNKMTFLAYLKDQRKTIFMVSILFLFTCGWLKIYPQIILTWDFVLTLFFLFLGILSLFLIQGYLRKRDYYKALLLSTEEVKEKIEGEDFPQKEEKFVIEIVNALKEKQKEQLQTLILKQQNQEEFLNQWVHEIKIPIAALSLMKESLEDVLPEMRYYQMEMELDKIEKNVQQVLYYTRLDTFSKDYLIEELEIEKVVQQSLKNFANYFILKHLKLQLKGENFQILSDGKWLRYILEQILSNAVKYTPENGTITIEMKDKNGYQTLEVKDTGFGIYPEDIPRVFEKGFTGSLGRQEEKSTGLGLYLAKNLMEKLGHDLLIESQVEKGTTVTLVFGKGEKFSS